MSVCVRERHLPYGLGCMLRMPQLSLSIEYACVHVRMHHGRLACRVQFQQSTIFAFLHFLSFPYRVGCCVHCVPPVLSPCAAQPLPPATGMSEWCQPQTDATCDRLRNVPCSSTRFFGFSLCLSLPGYFSAFLPTSLSPRTKLFICFLMCIGAPDHHLSDHAVLLFPELPPPLGITP